jgi:hypothetical protein
MPSSRNALIRLFAFSLFLTTQNGDIFARLCNLESDQKPNAKFNTMKKVCILYRLSFLNYV